MMGKVRKYFESHPIVSVFGTLGIAIIIIGFVVSSILQEEIVSLWNNWAHKDDGITSFSSNSNGNRDQMINEKSWFYTLKDVRMADLEFELKEIQFQIKDNKGEVFSSLGESISILPKSMSLINTDYNIDCSEHSRVEKDGNTIYNFQDLIPGNYKISYSIDGFIGTTSDFYIDAKSIFDGCWRMIHYIDSMNQDTFYHAAIITLGAYLDPRTGEHEAIPYVSYSVKLTPNDPFLYLGQTTSEGKSEHSFHCPKNTRFYVQLEYNGVTTEVEILFNQEHTGMPFFLQPNGQFVYEDTFWD